MSSQISAFQRPARAGTVESMHAPRGVVRRRFKGVCALSLTLALTACATQPPAPPPPPRPTQGTGMQCPVPEYPVLARRQAVQAQVAVRLKVELDGSVSEASIVQSAQTGRDWTGLYLQAAQALDAAALRMGKSCRFAPGVGHYAPARVRLPVAFKLSD